MNRRKIAPRFWITAWGIVTVSMISGCRDELPPPVIPPETAKLEDRAGPFLEYYEQVLRLAQRHAAHPDSFKLALDAMPGSHLDARAWDTWTQRERTNPKLFAEKLEAIIAASRPSPGRGSGSEARVPPPSPAVPDSAASLELPRQKPK